MAPDSGEPDAAALRDRVAQLEQTVADQQATIESLSPPTASRRGVLAALTGVAGAGALGAYSQRASAQAAGQVGTQSEPVDVEAYDLNVQNQLAGDLDAGGNSLTNVGAIETGSVDAARGLINNITIDQSNISSLTLVSDNLVSVARGAYETIFDVAGTTDVVSGLVTGGRVSTLRFTWDDGTTDEIYGVSAASDVGGIEVSHVVVPPIRDISKLEFMSNQSSDDLYAYRLLRI